MAFEQNMRNLEKSHEELNDQLHQLGLSSDPEGESDILSLTNHLATISPELVEASYSTRVQLMRTLTDKTGKIIEKKSRRLAGLDPEKRDLLEIKNQRERGHLMIDALEQAKQSKRGSKQSSPSQPANEEIDSNNEF